MLWSGCQSGTMGRSLDFFLGIRWKRVKRGRFLLRLVPTMHWQPARWNCSSLESHLENRATNSSLRVSSLIWIREPSAWTGPFSPLDWRTTQQTPWFKNPENADKIMNVKTYVHRSKTNLLDANSLQLSKTQIRYKNKVRELDNRGRYKNVNYIDQVNLHVGWITNTLIEHHIFDIIESFLIGNVKVFKIL